MLAEHRNGAMADAIIRRIDLLGHIPICMWTAATNPRTTWKMMNITPFVNRELIGNFSDKGVIFIYEISLVW